MSEKKLEKIYQKWLDEGSIMTDWGLMEWLGDNYILIKKPKKNKKK